MEKKNFLKSVWIVLCVMTMLASCKKYDDTEVRNQLSDHERRIASLEAALAAVNAQISGIQSVLSSIEEGDRISSVIPTADGYIINLTKGGPIIIKHDANGEDDNDGAPIIGIDEEGGVYYWTISQNGNTEWLTDKAGQKISLIGVAGAEGLTPILGVDAEGYWTIKWGDNPPEHLLSDGQKVLARISNIPFRLEISVENSELVFNFFESGSIIRIPFAQAYAISIAEARDYTLYVSNGNSKTFTVNVEDIAEADYLSLAAEIAGRAGSAADVHIQTRASSGWGVEVGNPVFSGGNATFSLKITAPTGIDYSTNEPNALLTLTLLANDGKKATAAFAVVVQPQISMKTAASQVELKLDGTGEVTINWGDGSPSQTYTFTGSLLPLTHAYAETSRTITISGENITYLDCHSNQLTSLDVSNNTALTHLYCQDNQLTSLDVSNNSALEILGCDNNQLSSLDVSNNSALEILSCDNNPLSSLDVSNNSELERLFCRYNQLSSLDMSNNNALIYLDCRANLFDAAALNALFGTLNAKVFSGKVIVIKNNPGAAACDPSIATAKWWDVFVFD